MFNAVDLGEKVILGPLRLLASASIVCSLDASFSSDFVFGDVLSAAVAVTRSFELAPSSATPVSMVASSVSIVGALAAAAAVTAMSMGAATAGGRALGCRTRRIGGSGKGLPSSACIRARSRSQISFTSGACKFKTNKKRFFFTHLKNWRAAYKPEICFLVNALHESGAHDVDCKLRSCPFN